MLYLQAEFVYLVGLFFFIQYQCKLAGAIQQLLLAAVEELRKQMRERTGMTLPRDSELLGLLVFFERLQIQYNNQRPRGKAFLSFLLAHFPMQDETEKSSLLAP